MRRAPRARCTRTLSSQQVDHHARGLVDLTTRDLVVLLARTEDQTRDLRPDTIDTDITRQLLRHQHEILTELDHRRNRTTPT